MHALYEERLGHECDFKCNIAFTQKRKVAGPHCHTKVYVAT